MLACIALLFLVTLSTQQDTVPGKKIEEYLSFWMITKLIMVGLLALLAVYVILIIMRYYSDKDLQRRIDRETQRLIANT